jgi:hypothetical protein
MQGFIVFSIRMEFRSAKALQVVNVPNCLIVRPLAMPTVMLILLLSPCHFTIIKKIGLFWYTSEHHGYYKEIDS